MRVFVAGDVHANVEWWLRVCEAAVREECRQILQAGDFGWWPHVAKGDEFVRFVHASLERFDLEASFIDGNHENFDDLWTRDTHVGPRLTYLPRGHHFVIGSMRFVALGGAWSHDQAHRQEGISWWSQELLREEDLVAASSEPVDVVLSHDAPSGIEGWKGREDPTRPSYAHRLLVRRVVDAVKPRLVIHGHYHRRYTDRLILDDGSTVRVEGLGRDGDPTGAAVILDCDSGLITDSSV